MEWWTQRRDNAPRPTRGDVRPTVSEITDYLLVGEYPRDHDIEWLSSEHGVTAIHNLQDDEDLRINALDIAALREVSARHGIKLVRTPIQDGSADDMADRLRAALGDLASLIGAHERVYTEPRTQRPHPRNRLLAAFGGMSLDEALAHVKRRRSCGPFMTVLEDYFGPRDLKPAS